MKQETIEERFFLSRNGMLIFGITKASPRLYVMHFMHKNEIRWLTVYAATPLWLEGFLSLNSSMELK